MSAGEAVRDLKSRDRVYVHGAAATPTEQVCADSIGHRVYSGTPSCAEKPRQ